MPSPPRHIISIDLSQGRYIDQTDYCDWGLRCSKCLYLYSRPVHGDTERYTRGKCFSMPSLPYTDREEMRIVGILTGFLYWLLISHLHLQVSQLALAQGRRDPRRGRGGRRHRAREADDSLELLQAAENGRYKVVAKAEPYKNLPVNHLCMHWDPFGSNLRRDRYQKIQMDFLPDINYGISIKIYACLSPPECVEPRIKVSASVSAGPGHSGVRVFRRDAQSSCQQVRKI